MTRIEIAKAFIQIEIDKMDDPALKEIMIGIIGVCNSDINWLWVFRVLEKHNRIKI